MRVPSWNFKWPSSGAGVSAKTTAWSHHLTFGNALAVVGIGIPLALGAWRSRLVYNNFRAKYFPNVLHVQLHTISRSPKYRNMTNPKYRVFTRTIYEKDLNDVIFNEHGIKVLQV